MGHMINYNTFSVKTSKEEIYAEVNEKAVREGDYHSSLPSIDWLNDCFNSKEEAKAYIEKKDANGFYNQYAVRYKFFENFVPSKALER